MLSRRPYTDSPYTKLGEGAFSNVYLVTQSSGKNAALKKPKIPDEASAIDKHYRIFSQEISIQANLNHPNIVSIIVCELTPKLDDAWILFEYADSEDLCDFLSKQPPKPLPLEEKISIIRQITDALVYLKQKHIVHADIKLDNIMLHHAGAVGSYYCAKLGDFGFAKRLEPNTSKLSGQSICGSLFYLAPESLVIGEYSYASDLFSFALIMYALFTGKFPYYTYEADRFQHILKAIYFQNNLTIFSLKSYLVNNKFTDDEINFLIENNLRVPFPKNIPHILGELIQICWQGNPLQRISIESVRQKLTCFEPISDSDINITSGQLITIEEEKKPSSIQKITEEFEKLSIAKNHSSFFKQNQSEENMKRAPHQENTKHCFSDRFDLADSCLIN